MYEVVETEFNLDKHLVNLLRHVPFYAEISRNIHKIPCDTIETAGVLYNKELDELQLLWSPKFFMSLQPQEIMGVIVHELYHIINEHIFSRMPDRKWALVWNYATDLAVNSIIKTTNDKNIQLPKSALVPGTVIQGDPALVELVKKFPPLQASEWYFERLKKEIESGNCDGGKGDGTAGNKPGAGSSPGKGLKGKKGSESDEGTENGDNSASDDPSGSNATFQKGLLGKQLDNHSEWQDGNSDDGSNDRTKAKVKSIIKKAIQHADQQTNGWGNIPASVCDEIRQRVSRTIDWRKALKQFVGSLATGGRSSTIKKLNRKQPYDHPGVKRNRTAKLLVAVDQSGSVSDDLLSYFIAEILNLTRKVEVDYVPFDCELDRKQVITLRKGAKVKLKRVKTGGTDFNAPTELFNDPKNRGRWDALLIVTDGDAPKPKSCRKKRGWVLPAGNKLAFDTNETKIFIVGERKMSNLVIDFKNPGPTKDALIKNTCDTMKKNPLCTVSEAQKMIGALENAMRDVDNQVKAHNDAQRDIANDERKMPCDGKSK
jgi:predicted metal-dependent peptidase